MKVHWICFVPGRFRVGRMVRPCRVVAQGAGGSDRRRVGRAGVHGVSLWRQIKIRRLEEKILEKAEG